MAEKPEIVDDGIQLIEDQLHSTSTDLFADQKTAFTVSKRTKRIALFTAIGLVVAGCAVPATAAIADQLHVATAAQARDSKLADIDKAVDIGQVKRDMNQLIMGSDGKLLKEKPLMDKLGDAVSKPVAYTFRTKLDNAVDVYQNGTDLEQAKTAYKELVEAYNELIGVVVSRTETTIKTSNYVSSKKLDPLKDAVANLKGKHVGDEFVVYWLRMIGERRQSVIDEQKAIAKQRAAEEKAAKEKAAAEKKAAEEKAEQDRIDRLIDEAVERAVAEARAKWEAEQNQAPSPSPAPPPTNVPEPGPGTEPGPTAEPTPIPVPPGQ